MLAELGLADLAPMPSSALAVVTDRGGGGADCQKSSARRLTAGIAIPNGCSYRSSSEADLRDLNSFSDEPRNIYDTLDLSKELRQAAEQCQLLAERLKKKGDPNKSAADDESNEDKSCCHEIQKKYRLAMAENIKSRQVSKDVTEINKRWQKYNRQQQEYIQRLLGNIRTLQQEKAEAEVAAILKRPEETESRRLPLAIRHSDSSLMDQSSMVSQLRQSYENAVKENCKLQKDLEDLRQKERGTREELEALKVARSEEAGLLEMQLKAHKEDWEAEKREKEVERGHASRLKEQTDLLTIQLRNCRDRLSSLEINCKCGAVDELEGWRMLRRHRSASPSAPFPAQRNIVVDSRHSHSQPELLERGVTSTAANDLELVNPQPNVVTCPGCQMKFTSQEHLEFLDHFEKCQKRIRAEVNPRF